ncbi:MAG: single-stranded-DNA-specific exonuclease RecJ [Anaerolineae bacterium]|nr:single-stranded-DNA-specific exonuclease RecJ [Anaerolineae bacterium]
MTDLCRKRWQVMPPAPEAFLKTLPDFHPLVKQVLYNRGIVQPDALQLFLEWGVEDGNPFHIQDVEVAVALIRRVITRGAPIVVYGDYDVDGVTATAILALTLQSLGADVRTYIPNREDEGYGLNAEAIHSLAEEGMALLITVDCGIRSLEEVALAQRLGMEVIITDHHHIGPALPKAAAVINPKRPDCQYPFKDFAGAGVAFKLAQALLRVNKKVPLTTTQSDLHADDLLDLVALGTVADMVPLLGENHVLVQQGLKHMNGVQRPGISALIQVSGIRLQRITSNTIAFTLAPRLNAAGRLSKARTALELLLASDMAQAFPLAQQLDSLNQERRELTEYIQEQCQAIIAAQPFEAPLLFAASKDFTSGVVGLAASRLVDKFYRPSVVVAIEGELSRASARSIPEFHITDALDSVSDLLERHGGHAAAAGFTVRTQLLPVLKDRLTALAAEQLAGKMLCPTLDADAEVPLATLSWDIYNTLEQLRPFGYGNPAPLLISRRVKILHARAVGSEGQHLKLVLGDEQGQGWDGIAFKQGDWVERLPDYIDVAYILERNEWNGRVNLQLNIQDIHPYDGKDWQCVFS